MDKSESWRAYLASRYRSIKHSTYFDVYDHLFSRFIGKPITFIEIGVLSGGSLFMWREFFGPSARIIGVDLNPNAKKWEEHGFEIFVGSQSDPSFWKDTLAKIGPVDIILDDGGHTYRQQVQTFVSCVGNIKDNGLLVVEDTHTSYMKGFGPSRYSFVEFSKKIIDLQNMRFGGFASEIRGQSTWSISFYESFVAFHIDRQKVSIASTPTDNGGEADNSEDFRYRRENEPLLSGPIRSRLSFSRLGRFILELPNRISRERELGRSTLRKEFRRASVR